MLLMYGSRGNQVAKIQTILGIKPDGVFGKNTKAAVIAFQNKHGLKADGIVGPNTMEILMQTGNRPSPPQQIDYSKLPNSAQKRVDAAKIVFTQYKKNGTKYLSNQNRQFGLDAKLSDCSAAVTTMLRLANQGELFKTAYTKGMMTEIARRPSNNKPRKDNPLPGDLMFWGHHVAIVVGVQNGVLSFVHMISRGITLTNLQLQRNRLDVERVWGAGGFVGFWTPEK